jgi:hypothetical protein
MIKEKPGNNKINVKIGEKMQHK